MKTASKIKSHDYSDKFKKFSELLLFQKLTEQDRRFIEKIAYQYRLTFQEFRKLVTTARDLEMWGLSGIKEIWENVTRDKSTNKKDILNSFYANLNKLKSAPTIYKSESDRQSGIREKVKIKTSSRTGMCPVASPKTVCCQLHTIDAVETCVFGCSYCTIQTFYDKDIVFTTGLDKKLKDIQLEKDRYYHFGSGQSSDALAWGNKEGILDAQCNFAADNPNVLMEFKTKSDNIRYFLKNDMPENIVCSWSLNPQIIIDNEEHFTASVEKRIESALKVSKKGIKVSFHFHPMIWYEGWKEGYAVIAQELIDKIDPENVLFISFGSVTFIKPVLQQIRKRGFSTKITQMEFFQDPPGKLTYPDEIKIEMFKSMHKKSGGNKHSKYFQAGNKYRLE